MPHAAAGRSAAAELPPPHAPPKASLPQDSSHSEAAEDLALEQAYEQLLHKLQDHHPQPRTAAGRTQETQQQLGGSTHEHGWQGVIHQDLQQSQAPAAPAFDGCRKRRRRSRSSPLGPGSCGAAAAAGSVDSLASAAALAVPVGLPAQALAQISELSASEQQQQQQQQQQEVGPTPPIAVCSPVPGRHAQLGGEASSPPAQQDWSAAAAAVSQALMQQQEGDVLEAATAKAGMCRLDLSLTAMLIGSQLDGGHSQTLAGHAPVVAPAGVAAARLADAAEAAGTEGGMGAAARRRRPAAVHGNYRRYYGYRYFGDQRPEDPRLQVLRHAASCALRVWQPLFATTPHPCWRLWSAACLLPGPGCTSAPPQLSRIRAPHSPGV
jgi:hypothetical protein